MKKQETVVYCLEKCKNIEIVFMIEVWSDGWKLRVDVKDFRADQGKEMTMKGNIAQYCPRVIGWPLGQNCLREKYIYSRRLPETAVQGHCQEMETRELPGEREFGEGASLSRWCHSTAMGEFSESEGSEGQ